MNVKERTGRISDLRWTAWKPSGYTPDIRVLLWGPLRTNPTHTLGWTTTVRYTPYSLTLTRTTVLMGSGKKRMRVTGKKRTYEEARIVLTVTGGVRRLVRTVGGKIVEPLTVARDPIKTDLSEWFNELHAKVAGCYDGGEFAPLWDWMIESNPIAAEYLDSPGWLPTGETK